MEQPEKSQDFESIGVATMEADGTICLQLRAEAPDSGTIGDAYFRYPPSHTNYQEILRHIGDIKPGETKPVPPWEDDEEDK